MAEFKIKALSNIMGAEITGLDLNNKISKDDKKKINCASFGTLGVLFKDKQIIKSGLTTFEPEIFFKSINKKISLFP